MFQRLRHLTRKFLTLKASDRDLIDAIRRRKLTYLSDEKLVSLLATCHSIERKGLAGIFIEAGCALGGSSALISRSKDQDRAFRIYDVFGMIPPPTDEDSQDVHDRYATILEGKSAGIGGDEYYGYKENLYETVKQNLESFGIRLDHSHVSLIKGLIQETMAIDQPVALAHIDVDWYEPVMTSLQRIFPRLVVGGSMILDDYYDWGGCRKAADEYLASVAGQYALDGSSGALKITRIESC